MGKNVYILVTGSMDYPDHYNHSVWSTKAAALSQMVNMVIESEASGEPKYGPHGCDDGWENGYLWMRIETVKFNHG